MRNPAVLTVAAVVCLAVWVQLTFRMDFASGWTHVPLVLAVLLAVVAIVEADARTDRPGKTPNASK